MILLLVKDGSRGNRPFYKFFLDWSAFIVQDDEKLNWNSELDKRTESAENLVL